MLDQVVEYQLPLGGGPDGSTHDGDDDLGLDGPINVGDQGEEHKGYVVYFDGACGPPNPGGPAGFGAIVFLDGQAVWECSEVYAPPAGVTTSNNAAEYSGLVVAFKWFVRNSLTDAPIVVYGDSQLVINQVFGDWRIKRGLYVPLAREAKELRSLFTNIRGCWIPRDQNAVADALSKRSMPQDLRNYDWVKPKTDRHVLSRRIVRARRTRSGKEAAQGEAVQ